MRPDMTVKMLSGMLTQTPKHVYWNFRNNTSIKRDNDMVLMYSPRNCYSYSMYMYQSQLHKQIHDLYLSVFFFFFFSFFIFFLNLINVLTEKFVEPQISHCGLLVQNPQGL